MNFFSGVRFREVIKPLAESFADEFVNSDDAKELSKEVKKLTLERLKRGKL